MKRFTAKPINEYATAEVAGVAVTLLTYIREVRIKTITYPVQTNQL
jgi:hypothetical protein